MILENGKEVRNSQKYYNDILDNTIKDKRYAGKKICSDQTMNMSNQS